MNFHTLSILLLVGLTAHTNGWRHLGFTSKRKISILRANAVSSDQDKGNRVESFRKFFSAALVSASLTFSTINPIYANEGFIPCNLNTVSVLQDKSNNREVIIVGTAHISEDSANLVKNVIQNAKPDTVMIELDAKRIGRVSDGRTLEELGFISPKHKDNSLAASEMIEAKNSDNRNPIKILISKVFAPVREGVQQLGGFVLGKVLSKFYQNIENVGFTAGGEFKAAIEEARSLNANIVDDGQKVKILLGDRDVDTTLRRLATAIGSVDQTKLQETLEKLDQLQVEAGLQLSPELDKSQIREFVEQLKDNDVVVKLMSVIKSELPDVYNALVGERDQFMAESILEMEDSNRLVAVVGLAHLKGIDAYLINNAGFQITDKLCK